MEVREHPMPISSGMMKQVCLEVGGVGGLWGWRELSPLQLEVIWRAGAKMEASASPDETRLLEQRVMHAVSSSVSPGGYHAWRLRQSWGFPCGRIGRCEE